MISFGSYSRNIWLRPNATITLCSRLLRGSRRGSLQTRDGLDESSGNQPRFIEKDNFIKSIENSMKSKYSSNNLNESKSELISSSNSPNKTKSELISSSTNSHKTKSEVISSKEEKTPFTYRTIAQQARKRKFELSDKLTEENQFELARDAVNMLHGLPYNEQTELKQNKNKNVIFRLKKDCRVERSLPNIQNCRLSSIVKAENKIQYRNHDEFSLNINLFNQPTVGYFVANEDPSGPFCVEPRLVTSVREDHKNIASLYQQFVRKHTISPNLYLGKKKGGEPGHWGNITVRSNIEGEIMVTVNFHSLEILPETIDQAKMDLVEYLKDSSSNIVSIYMSNFPTCELRDENSSLLHLYGVKHITSETLGQLIDFGPKSRMPINLSMLETLLDSVSSRLESGRSSDIFLGLFCGVGFLHLPLASLFSSSIGIDSDHNVSLARHNAQRAGIQNCKFVADDINSVISQVTKDLKNSKNRVSALITPDFGGLNHHAIKELLSFSSLDTILYLTSQPDDSQVYYNLQQLVKQNDKFSVQPFTLVESLPIDMCPDTQHCLHLFLFKRSIS